MWIHARLRRRVGTYVVRVPPTFLRGGLGLSRLSSRYECQSWGAPSVFVWEEGGFVRKSGIFGRDFPPFTSMETERSAPEQQAIASWLYGSSKFPIPHICQQGLNFCRRREGAHTRVLMSSGSFHPQSTINPSCHPPSPLPS